MYIAPKLATKNVIVMNCSDEYIHYLNVCLKSIQINSKKNKLYDLVILEKNITEENKNFILKEYNCKNFSVRFVNSNDLLNFSNLKQMMSFYSTESYLKLIVAEIFRQYKKVLYIDIDIIVKMDIATIFDIEMKNNPIAMTRDYAINYVIQYENPIDLPKYFKEELHLKNFFNYGSAGLILFDIEKIKDEDTKKLLDLAYKRPYVLQEQDILNIYFENKITYLPYRYLVNIADNIQLDKLQWINTECKEDFQETKTINAKILHFSGERKPWFNDLQDRNVKYWWKYAKETNSYDFLLDNFSKHRYITNRDNNMSIQKNLYLFIIWEKARHLENEILKRMNKEFKILKKFAIKWDEDKFHDNIYSFGGGCLVNSNFHEEHKGKGEFLMVLIEDGNENLEVRLTAQDKMLVNKNVFDFKYKTRAELLNNMCSLHASNNIKETRHDFALLTGQSLEDFINNNKLDGETIYLKQNLPCVDGWRNLSHIFYILNETVNYAVLRNFEGLPNEVIVDEHTDIDILVEDMQNFISVLEGSKLRDDIFKIRVYADIKGTEALFHCKYIGDDYYDKKWQRKILENRILNQNNIYVPDEQEYFYSLLYHALYQKTYVSNTYIPIFNELMPKLGLEVNTNIEHLKHIMEKYLVENNYKIAQPYENLDPKLQVPDTLLGRNNIDNASIIDEEDEYYIVKGRHGVSIFNKKLAGIDSLTATRFMLFNEENRFEPFVNWSYRLYKINAHELKNYRKYIDKNTLFITFRKRFGHISIQKCISKKNKKIIIKRFIELISMKRYKIQFLWMYPNEKREYTKGITITDILKSMKDIKEQEKVLDIFIGKVFEKFSINDFNFLNGKAFDMTTDNCLYEDNGNWKFFDFEYEYIKPMPKSYALYRIIENSGINTDKYELYKKYFNKLQIPEQYYYYQDIDKQIFNSVCCPPKNSKLFKFLCNLIPIKSIRRKYRNKYKGLNYHYFKRIFGKENV